MAWIVERSFGQVIISDTELDRLSGVVLSHGSDCRFFEVNRGTITPRLD